MNSSLQIMPAKRKGVTFFYRGRYLASKYDPITEGKRIIEQSLCRDFKTFIFLGFFPFYHIYHLFLKLDRFNNKIIFIIDDLGFKWLVYEKVILELENFFSTSSDTHYWQKKIFPLQKLEDILDQLTFREITEITFIHSPYSSSHLKSQSQRIFLKWKQYKQKELVTDKYFSLFWYFNTLKNLKTGPINLIENIKISSELKTAFLVVSGPSLEKKINWLKSQSKGYPIFAVAGITPLLLKNGIPVTAIISSDGSFYNTYHIKMNLSSIPLICALSSHPLLKRVNKRNVFFYIDLVELKELCLKRLALNPINWVAMNGSVTLMGVSILENLGFKSVVLVGNDFTHWPFKAHAQSNSIEELAFSKTTRMSSYENLLRPLFRKLKQEKDNHSFREEKLNLYQQRFNQLKMKSKIAISSSEEAAVENFLVSTPLDKSSIDFSFKRASLYFRNFFSVLKPKIEKTIHQGLKNEVVKDLFLKRLSRIS